MYDTFSNDYDRFVNWDNRLAGELPFIEHLLAEVAAGGPARLLDAACGTGKHAIALAQRGHTCAGADLSAPMIARARVNAAAAGVAIPFAAVGFGGLAGAFAGAFDAVLCLGNSLPHLLTPAALADALTDFAACLRPGGLLLIQNRNFDAVTAARQRWMEPQTHREGERQWLFLRFYDFDADGLLTFNIITLRQTNGLPWEQSVASTRLRPLLHLDLSAALAAAGFASITAYGGLDGSPFEIAKSGNLVLAAYKHPRP
jgi:SAM-dependent methyltransferase